MQHLLIHAQLYFVIDLYKRINISTSNVDRFLRNVLCIPEIKVVYKGTLTGLTMAFSLVNID